MPGESSEFLSGESASQKERERPVAERIEQAREELEKVLNHAANDKIPLGHEFFAQRQREMAYFNVDLANSWQFAIDALEKGIEPEDYWYVGSVHPDHVDYRFGRNKDDITVPSYYHDVVHGGLKRADDTKPLHERSVEVWRKKGLDYRGKDFPLSGMERGR